MGPRPHIRGVPSAARCAGPPPQPPLAPVTRSSRWLRPRGRGRPEAPRARAIVRREMGEDRITELRIEGLRTIERIRLPLDGLTVLIGENGSGKSSIVEACELLRRAAGPQLVPELHAVHGGMFSLLRDGASELRLGVTVEHRGDEPPLRYDFALASQGVGTVVTEESLQLGPGGHVSEAPDAHRTQRGERTPVRPLPRRVAGHQGRLVHAGAGLSGEPRRAPRHREDEAGPRRHRGSRALRGAAALGRARPSAQVRDARGDAALARRAPRIVWGRTSRARTTR